MSVESLGQFTTGTIEKLENIREEIAILRERLDKLEEMKGKVNPKVYERIRRDYLSRIEQFDKEAQPLEKELHKDYKELMKIYKSLARQIEDLELQIEEVEVRYELGEFSDESCEQRLSELKDRLEKEREDFAKIESIRNRFLEVLPTLESDRGEYKAEEELVEEELKEEEFFDEEEVVEEIFEDKSEKDSEEIAVYEDQESEEEIIEEEEAGFPPELPPMTREIEEEKIEFSDEIESDEVEITREETVGTVVDQTDSMKTVFLDDDRTDVKMFGAEASPSFSGEARLILAEEGEEYILTGDYISIGRAPDNDIRVMDEAVSRYHAAVVLTEKGYVIRDLQSNNGTYVNGESIDEILLKDGDTISIGTKVLYFKVE